MSELDLHNSPYTGAQIDEALRKIVNDAGVFVADYGSTTGADIVAAVNAGQACVCKAGNNYFVLVYVQGSDSARFVQLTSLQGRPVFKTLEVFGNAWTSWQVDGETTGSKVQEISPDDDENKYPSSQAVQAYVAANGGVFVAEYGTTTYQEVVDAHNAGKVCVVKFADSLYYLDDVFATYAKFLGGAKNKEVPVDGYNSYVVRAEELYALASGGWSTGYVNAESPNNRTNEITADSTDVNYPTAKAVVDYVAPMAEAAANAQTAADTAEEYALKAYVTPTASGEIASLDDGAEDIPVKSLTVDIEPVQDLNGYDAPWPPGGGKNLLGVQIGLSTTNNGISCSIEADGRIKCVGTSTATSWGFGDSYHVELPAGTYTLSTDGLMEGRVVLVNDDINDAISVANPSIPASTFVLDSTAEVHYYIAFSEGVTVNQLVSVQVERGSTATAYTPYSNICPISGWTGANVQRTGKNLLDLQKVVEDANSPKVYISANGDFHFSTDNVGNGAFVWYADKAVQGAITISGDFITAAGLINLLWFSALYSDGTTSALFNTGQFTGDGVAKHLEGSTDPTKTLVRISSVWTTSTPTTVKNFQLELGSTATAYEPYQGESYAISFPDEAGTVYGGTLDVTSGVLTVDAKGVTLNGSENWFASNLLLSRCANLLVEDLMVSGSNLDTSVKFLYCSSYEPSTVVVGSTERYGKILPYFNTTACYLGVGFNEGTEPDIAGFKAYLAENPMQVVYPIEPITYQLTPTEVTTLLGVNNIYADTGDTTVQYRADPTLIYNKLTAAIISSSGTV